MDGAPYQLSDKDFLMRIRQGSLILYSTLIAAKETDLGWRNSVSAIQPVLTSSGWLLRSLVSVYNENGLSIFRHS